MWPFQWKVLSWALLSCATVYCAVQVGSVLLVSLQVKTTLGCDHSSEKCWEEFSFGAVTNGIRISNIVIFFLSFLYIFRWCPSCYILLKPSAVWGYTSLRIWDRLTVGRVSASLSRSALIYMIRLKFPGIKLLREFLRYHTFALCYSSRLGNSGNFCVCNPECRKLFLVESRIQVPLTRNPQAVTWNSEFTAWNQEFDYLKWSDYLFIYLFIKCCRK